MKVSRFQKNFARVNRAWIPRQAKSAGGKGPNATEAKYLREVLKRTFDENAIIYQPPPIVITKTTQRKYTADYLVTFPDGTKMYHEVKGSYHLPTHERARLAWEIAAEQNPDAIFMWAELTRKGWEFEVWVKGGKEIYAHVAGDKNDDPVKVDADWRRHKPRKSK